MGDSNFFGGLGDILWGSTDKINPKDIRSPQQMALFNDLMKYASPGAAEYLKTAGDPFPNSLVNPTGFNDWQKQLLGQSQDLFKGGDFTQNPLFKQSVDVMSRTAEGFDPFKDTRLTTFKDQLSQEIKRAKDRIAAKGSSRDSLFGGGTRNAQGEVESQGIRDIGSLAAQLEAESRQQAMQAAAQLPNLAQLQYNAPIDMWNQQFEMAGIPTQLQEAIRMAQLQELSRQRGELSTLPDFAAGLSTYKPELMYQAYSSTPGMLGGASGIGYQPNGGVNRNVQMLQTGINALAGAGMGGGAGIMAPAMLGGGSGGIGGGIMGGLMGGGGMGGGMLNSLLLQQMLSNGGAGANRGNTGMPASPGFNPFMASQNLWRRNNAIIK